MDQANPISRTAGRAERFGRVAVGAAVLWTVAVGLALVWSARQAGRAAGQTALAAARVSLDKDRGYLRWMTEHGGVFVPVSRTVRPDVELSGLPDRDARTTSGRPLTRVEPMDVLREVDRLTGDPLSGPGLAGRIASLRSRGGEHSADPWEATALTALADGRTEYAEITQSAGVRQLRLMEPLDTAPACLSCHAADGWQVGTVHGGFSVAVPMAPYEAVYQREFGRLALLGGAVWLMGLLGIGGTAARVHVRERERQHAVGLLAASTERFRVTAELTGQALYDHDPIRNATTWLGAVEAILGFTPEELCGLSAEGFAELIHEDDRAQACEVYRQGVHRLEPVFAEYRLRRKDGTYCWVEDCAAWLRDADGKPYRMLGVVQDITERRQLEHQLRQTQKLESLGVLAGGIAHDFNNLLTTILGHADLALGELPAGSALREDLTEIEHASRRAAELCRQMLAYAGRGGLAREPVALHTQVEETIQLLQAGLDPKVELRLCLADDLPPVPGDAAQLHQMVAHLLLNAVEALGKGGGTVTVTTTAAACTRDELRGSAVGGELPAGRYVGLVVSDTGCGMDDEALERVFEPFYTTKFLGRGLGLSATLGIVRAHHGGIWVSSAPGRGTTVRVLFPASEPVAATPPAPATPLGGAVLLVDDEPGVRDVTRRMLEQLGFTVIAVGSGAEAVAAYRDSAGTIALVVLDLTMPGMSGEETFAALQAVNPEVRAVVTSGHSEADSAARFGERGPAGYVQKPYTLERLREQVEAALRAERPA
ncbi:MAG: PAS domain-containing protein [Armatimonadetes bacterium]|nr:PAS domain-containing protein [Armatimonadota bacterium]